MIRYVIIGAGIAGVSAAETIKKIDNNSEVILIGDERFFPYNRYLLTEFLCGSIDNDKMFYTSAEFFAKIGVKLRRSELVKSINSEQKSIKFFHNEVMTYDKLLIATGGCPVLGPVLRSSAKNIQRYYSLRDILLLKKKLPKINQCIVYGGGVSTLDLICGLFNLGKKIIYIDENEKVEFPLIESEFSKDIHNFLLDRGVEIISNDRIIEVNKIDNKFQVLTLNKKEVTGDIVFAWDHYTSNIECIAGTNIEKKIGILVDQELKTSVEDIYAAGDCVEIYHPGIKDYWVNFGWLNAAQQGVIAGKNMTGLREQYQIQETIVFNVMGKELETRWWL